MTRPSAGDHAQLRDDLPRLRERLSSAKGNGTGPDGSPALPIVRPETFREEIEQPDGTFLLSPANAARFVFDHHNEVQQFVDHVLGRAPAPEHEESDDLVTALLGAIWHVESYSPDPTLVLVCCLLGMHDTRVLLHLGFAGVTAEEVLNLSEQGADLPGEDRLRTLAVLRGVTFHA